MRWRVPWRLLWGLMPPLPAPTWKQQEMPLTDPLPPPAHRNYRMLSEKPGRLLKGRRVCQFCPWWWVAVF